MFVGGVTIFSIYVVFFPLIFSFPHQRLLFVHLYSSCAFSIFSGSLLVSLSCISSSASHAWSVSRTIWSADQKQFSSYSFTLNPFVPSQVHEGHILGKQQRFLKRWCFFVLLNSFGPSVYYIPLCFRGCINIKIGESLFYDFFFLYLSVVLWLLAGVTGYWSLVVAAPERERENLGEETGADCVQDGSRKGLGREIWPEEGRDMKQPQEEGVQVLSGIFTEKKSREKPEGGGTEKRQQFGKQADSENQWTHMSNRTILTEFFWVI